MLKFKKNVDMLKKVKNDQHHVNLVRRNIDQEEWFIKFLRWVKESNTMKFYANDKCYKYVKQYFYIII